MTFGHNGGGAFNEDQRGGHTPGPTAKPPAPATSGKYGAITAEKKQFHHGEPLFLIRATDPDAVEILTHAAACYAMRGSPPEQVTATMAAADRIQAWQAANPDRVKKAAD